MIEIALSKILVDVSLHVHFHRNMVVGMTVDGIKPLNHKAMVNKGMGIGGVQVGWAPIHLANLQGNLVMAKVDPPYKGAISNLITKSTLDLPSTFFIIVSYLFDNDCSMITELCLIMLDTLQGWELGY